MRSVFQLGQPSTTYWIYDGVEEKSLEEARKIGEQGTAGGKGSPEQGPLGRGLLPPSPPLPLIDIMIISLSPSQSRPRLAYYILSLPIAHKLERDGRGESAWEILIPNQLPAYYCPFCSNLPSIHQ